MESLISEPIARANVTPASVRTETGEGVRGGPERLSALAHESGAERKGASITGIEEEASSAATCVRY